MCGKCKSKSVYLDQDPINGAASLACMICGNRYPGGQPFYLAEPAQETPATQPAECVQGTSRPGRPLFERKEPIMTTDTAADVPSSKSRRNEIATGHCKNCLRNSVRVLVTMGMCFQCISYATNTKGDARIKRLAEAAKLYHLLKPGEKIRYGLAIAKQKGRPEPPAKRQAKANNIRRSLPKEDPCPVANTQSPLDVEDQRKADQAYIDLVSTSIKPKIHPARKYLNRMEVCFYEKDLEIWKFIVESSDRDRRTPREQVLFLLDLARADEMSSASRQQ
jgi:hypothetical protein